ncbi:MAG: hypothetical protein ABS61_01860 [Microbacterium sp. SCN 70-18]|nr:hypothetical protein [Microbacterium chocolatum]ODT11879.1 MAG: hypothetical protein ABS61_01860 [Microbacterium sp. SCN 70-18]
MLKKTAAALAVAGVIALGSATPAFAYPVAPSPGCTVSPAAFTAGVPSTIACVGLPTGPTVFSVTGPGVVPGVLASVASASASGSTSVTKTAGEDGAVSAAFTPPQTAAYTITVVDAEGATVASETLPAASGTGTGGSASGGGLAVTGGVFSAEMAWLGIGIIGVGGIAVTAAVARRRAGSVQS